MTHPAAPNLGRIAALPGHTCAPGPYGRIDPAYSAVQNAPRAVFIGWCVPTPSPTGENGLSDVLDHQPMYFEPDPDQ